jgi:hypothetical protein
MAASGLLNLFVCLFVSAHPDVDSGCCPPRLAIATCTGATPCRACKNCSQCKHCSSGGTCGVCAPATPAEIRPTPATPEPAPSDTGGVGLAAFTQLPESPQGSAASFRLDGARGVYHRPGCFLQPSSASLLVANQASRSRAQPCPYCLGPSPFRVHEFAAGIYHRKLDCPMAKGQRFADMDFTTAYADPRLSPCPTCFDQAWLDSLMKPRSPSYSLRAESLLKAGRGLEQSRRTTSALAVYTQIVRDYPGTSQATEAEMRIRILERRK